VEVEDEELDEELAPLEEVVGRAEEETRDVAERNAAEPPPVWRPLVEVTEDPEDDEEDVDDEPSLDVDEPPPPPEEDPPESRLPPELDRRLNPPPPPPPPLRKLPSRPPPLRLPRSCGLINEENFSAPVVPVSRIVRSIAPCAMAVVRIAAAADVSVAGRFA